MRGKVKSFNKFKGYGFIIPDEGGDDVFIHVVECLEPIIAGDPVLYELGHSRKTGRSEAKAVRLA